MGRGFSSNPYIREALQSIAASRRELFREEGVVAFGSDQTRGRGVFHIRGPRYDEALRRHGLASS